VGLGAPEPLEAVKEFVFLCHASCVTLSEEWLIAPHSRGSAWEPSSLDSSGHVFLCPGLGRCLRPREGQGSGLGYHRSGALGSGKPPSVEQRQQAYSGLARPSYLWVRMSIPDGYCPRAVLEGSVRGSPIRESLIPRLNIPIY
jgi:hypothetical protein